MKAARMARAVCAASARKGAAEGCRRPRLPEYVSWDKPPIPFSAEEKASSIHLCFGPPSRTSIALSLKNLESSEAETTVPPGRRSVWARQPWGGSSGGTSLTGYAYDLEDHLASVTDSERNQTAYVTSDRDLLTRQTSPVTGVTTYAYNGHGALVQQTDARGVVMSRQLDAADRPTSVTYSGDPTLTTTYVYDTTTTAGTFPIGRLSSIAKGSTNVSYAYDLFGRTLQDGALGLSYDANGNRASIAYPGNVTACYTYDIADRQAALSYSTAAGANPCAGATTLVVTSTAGAPTVYLAAGPLQAIHLANGLAETHTFDQRYYPTAITSGTLLNWTYTTDAVGNITAISPGRIFTYQDYQYFLTQANAATLWGIRAWTYDTLGNRLTENRGTGIQDTYNYLTNSASPHGDTPLLKTIALASSAGTKYLTYDAAGNVLQEAAPTSHLDFNADAAAKLSQMTEETQRTTATLTYDGRGFLATARNAVTDCGPLLTTPTYGSEGLLYSRQQQALFTGAVQAQTRVFYFAGRPVAQLDGPPATATLTYLSVDHLGTPNLASSAAGAATWSGGFEPFGRDYTVPSAQSSGIFLRFPGQWDDAVWDGARLSSSTFYNVNRWYDSQAGRYTQADRFLPPSWKDPNLLSYVRQRPSALADPLGLFVIDPSCDCAPSPPDNIYRSIGQARRFAISPKCQAILEKNGVSSCVANRFGPGESGKTPVIACQKNPPGSDACGETTDPVYGVPQIIHLYSGIPACPRYKPGFGLAVTLLHETVHSCGIRDESTVREITEVCTGWF